MEPHARQVRALQQRVERLTQKVGRIEEAADLVGEHEVRVFPAARARKEPLGGLMDVVTPKGIDGGAGEGNLSAGTSGLRFREGVTVFCSLN
jgi:hypothetical protein